MARALCSRRKESASSRLAPARARATAVGSTPAPLPSGPELTLSDSSDTPAPTARFVRIQAYPAKADNKPESSLNQINIPRWPAAQAPSLRLPMSFRASHQSLKPRYPCSLRPLWPSSAMAIAVFDARFQTAPPLQCDRVLHFLFLRCDPPNLLLAAFAESRQM